MGLITPIGLLLLTLALPIIALYLLKRRREDVLVSSTLLWERMLRDLEANAPWQRLRRNLLLFLQLLALALLVLAAARPFLRTSEVRGRNLVLIVDTSLSMGALDGDGGTRLDAARRVAMDLVNGLPPNGRMTVIRGGGGAEVVLAGSNDRVEVARALAALRPDAPDSDLSAAFQLAAAAVARVPESTIVLLSDGAVQLPTSWGAAGPPVAAAVHFIPVGESANNQAISALNLRPEGQGLALFVQVTNYGPEPWNGDSGAPVAPQSRSRRLLIDVDGQPFTAVDLDIPAGGRAERVFDLPGGSQVVHARLEGADILPADDQAWAVPPQARARRVRLLTRGNRFLQVALSLLPNVELTVAETLEPASSGERQGNEEVETTSWPELTILDAGWEGEIPPREADTGIPRDLPPGNILLIAPARNVGDIVVTGTISNPVPVPASVGDPLLRFVALEDVAILRAVRTELPSWARPVIQDAVSGVPLLWVGETGGRRVALLAFDLHASDLVLRVAFPILLANLVDELTLGRVAGLPTAAQVGRPVAVPVPPAVTEARLRGPDGAETVLTPTGGQVTFTPHRPGVYELHWPGTDRPPVRLAANIFSPGESNVAPVHDLPLPGGVAASANAGAQVGRRELWRWLAGLALAVLALEWLVAQREGVNRLRRYAARLTPDT